MAQTFLIRAYAANHNRMVYQDFYSFRNWYTSEIGQGAVFINNDATRRGLAEPMRYVGMNDQNGKYIFEKDIVAYAEHPGYLWPSFVAIIEWREEDASFGFRVPQGIGTTGREWREPFAGSDEFTTDVLPYLTVIGNLYQNPELIEE